MITNFEHTFAKIEREWDTDLDKCTNQKNALETKKNQFNPGKKAPNSAKSMTQNDITLQI